MDQSNLPRYRRYAWVIPFALGAVLVLFGLAEALFIGVDPDDFLSSTGAEWASFQAADPAVAGYINRLVRLIGILAVGFGAWVAIVAGQWLRTRDRAAWWAMWILPAFCIVAAGLFFAAQASLIGGFYLGYLVIALIGQGLAFPGLKTSNS